MESVLQSSKNKFLIYGSPRLSAGIVLDIIDFGIFTLYFFAYGMHPILQGIAMAIGKLCIAAAQFLMGWLSDSTKTKKYGKRKPFMFVFAPLTAIAFICALLPTIFIQNPTMLVLFVWILIWDAAFQFSYGGLTS